MNMNLTPNLVRKFALGTIAAVGGLMILGSCGSSPGSAPAPAAKPSVSAPAASPSPSAPAAKPSASTPKPAKPSPSAPATTAQLNALSSARSYLDMMGFSRAGLIEQLSSSAGDGYSKADATWAADRTGADWNEQAVRSGQSYLEMSGFSRAGLIEQLSSSAGDGYTKAQATYAAKKLGL